MSHDPTTTYPTSADGRSARRILSRSDQGELELPADRDPVGIIESQNEGRLRDLIPIRRSRMLESPFAFYRGSAAVMAADLKDAPTSGFDVVACGDAHLSNFGFYASPERNLVFDVNDFDEAAVAPWEWDVRRLVTSVHIAGRGNGLSERQCTSAATTSAHAYSTTLTSILTLSTTDRYFLRVDDSEIAQRFGKQGRKRLREVTDKARTRTSAQVLRKIGTNTEDGAVRIIDQPPLLRHTDDTDTDYLRERYAAYRAVTREDIAYLLLQFEPVDFALRVVGVGSVGTRCYVIALQDRGGETLFLQAKEAGESVLISHGGRPARLPGTASAWCTSQGQRVVAAQRILQASSDPFLGWGEGHSSTRNDESRLPIDYYWRQFRDMKGSVDPATLGARELGQYGALCAGILARAHAQSPTATAISGYLGGSDTFAKATARWAAQYADVAESDYEALCAAQG